MTISKLDQARIWAEGDFDQEYIHAGPRAAAEVIQSLPDQWIDADKLQEVIADWGNREVTSDAYTLYRQVLALLSTPTLPPLPKKTMEGVKWDGRKHHLAEAVADWIDIEPYEVVMIEPGSGDSNIKVWNPRMNEYRNVDSSALIPTGRKYKLTPDNSDDTSVNGAITKDSSLKERLDSLFGYDPTGEDLPEDVPAGEPWIVQHEGHEWVGTRESRVETVCSWALARLDGADYTVARDDEIALVSRLVPEVTP